MRPSLLCMKCNQWIHGTYGLQALLNRLQYQIQPTSISPQLLQAFLQAYGGIE